MARQVDENKLLLIKDATMRVVVQEGIAGASISKIAKTAGVSDGYLYRYYKGKRELLSALFEERFSAIHELLSEQIQTKDNVKDIISSFVKQIYKVAMVKSEAISFHHKLLSDFSFEIPTYHKKEINELCKQVLTLGQKTGEISKKITPEQFYAIVVGSMFQFINTRLRFIFSEKSFTNADIEQTIAFALKALR